MMLFLGGIGVDLMHNKMQRTRMKGVSDRAVLAASDLHQSTDSELVVRDYVTKFGLGDFVTGVREFVDLLLADGAHEYTTINLVPYAGQTHPGPFMFHRRGGTRLPVIALDTELGGIPEYDSHGILAANAKGGTGPLEWRPLCLSQCLVLP